MRQTDALTEQREPSGRDALRRQLETRIRRLERASGHGLWGMVIFLLVSLAAFSDFSIVPDLPETVRRLLGAPPPAEMISLALVVYAFSGIVYTLSRMTRNIPSYRGLMHAGFLSAFYCFYHVGGYLPDNFWAVFFAGLSVMGLENFYLWSYSGAALRAEKARLENLAQGRPIELAREDEDEESGSW